LLAAAAVVALRTAVVAALAAIGRQRDFLLRQAKPLLSPSALAGQQTATALIRHLARSLPLAAVAAVARALRTVARAGPAVADVVNSLARAARETRRAHRQAKATAARLACPAKILIIAILEVVAGQTLAALAATEVAEKPHLSPEPQ
jgi:hypothetical protein